MKGREIECDRVRTGERKRGSRVGELDRVTGEREGEGRKGRMMISETTPTLVLASFPSLLHCSLHSSPESYGLGTNQSTLCS